MNLAHEAINDVTSQTMGLGEQRYWVPVHLKEASPGQPANVLLE